MRIAELSKANNTSTTWGHEAWRQVKRLPAAHWTCAGRSPRRVVELNGQAASMSQMERV